MFLCFVSPFGCCVLGFDFCCLLDFVSPFAFGKISFRIVGRGFSSIDGFDLEITTGWPGLIGNGSVVDEPTSDGRQTGFVAEPMTA